MSLEFANRTCPNCKSAKYMVLLGDYSKAYKYKCINCNRYFNDIDFEEPLQPVWKTEFLNKKVDMVEVVRCRDCKHWKSESDLFGKCEQWHLSGVYSADWFCADGEKKG